MNRRRFLKYASATGAVLGASALGLDYVLGPRPGQLSQHTTGLSETTSASKINHPPVASFRRKPWYLDPTDQQTIQFTNYSTDRDGDSLSFRWIVDNQPVSNEKDYSAKLPVGQHLVELEASDSLNMTATAQAVTVEPDQIYPTKPLHIQHKGMRMTVGWKGMGRTPIDVTGEKLDAIHNELGCNAVIIFGNTEFEDDLIEAGKLAIEKRFDRIYVTPMYLDLSIDETVERIGEFASKVKKLREMSESVVFMVGHEFGLDSSSFVPGDTYEERSINAWNGHFDFKKAKAIMPNAFKKIILLCNKNYGYQITYAAIPWEADNVVPWSNPIFESVGSDAYIWDKAGWTESWVINHLSGLKMFRKPVNSTEWGCLTYKNASQDWQIAVEKYPYDEDEQANYIAKYCNMLNKAKTSGAFYTQIDDERPKGYGLYNGFKRKKGFYMYKSYRRSD